jgi:hypothetical protein
MRKVRFPRGTPWGGYRQDGSDVTASLSSRYYYASGLQPPTPPITRRAGTALPTDVGAPNLVAVLSNNQAVLNMKVVDHPHRNPSANGQGMIRESLAVNQFEGHLEVVEHPLRCGVALDRLNLGLGAPTAYFRPSTAAVGDGQVLVAVAATPSGPDSTRRWAGASRPRRCTTEPGRSTAVSGLDPYRARLTADVFPVESA